MAQNQSKAKAKRKELLKFGLNKLTHFDWHHNDTVTSKLVQLLPDGHSHICGFYSPNCITDHMIVDTALMDGIELSHDSLHAVLGETVMTSCGVDHIIHHLTKLDLVCLSKHLQMTPTKVRTLHQ